MSARVPQRELPSDWRMARVLGPVLAASALGLVPYTVFSTYLVPIAADARADVAVIGGLRGLGGLASLTAGALLAPLIDRVPRPVAAAGGLLVLAVASGVGALGGIAALTVFCLLVGAGLAITQPVLGAAAADRFDDDAAAGRAATLVTATQSLTAMLAAPVVALPALLWGWRGDFVAVAVLSVLLAAVVARGRGERPVERPERVGYLASLRALATVPGLTPLLLVALLRSTAFMGYLAYLAAYYDQVFGIGAGPFALVWTLSGTAFFLGNLAGGKLAAADRLRVGPRVLMPLSLTVGAVAVVVLLTVPVLWVALALTAVLSVAHAVAAACVITLLVRRAGAQRGAVLSVTSAAMSVGTFLGASLGGLGLAVAGYPGMAVALGVATLGAVVAGTRVRA
ncbi:MFS transporter [Actinokineospora sp. G85]|uniref:MFS transporter n=1 Tax=Actinokineospora sp. G85 TaxID=3406626 RepID=UPI003C709CB0